MKIYQTVIPVSLIILLSICSITYFTTNYIHQIRKLNENANKHEKIEKEEEFLNLKDEQTMKKLIQKIRHYESIERAPIEHLGLADLLKKEKNLRQLSSSNIFDDVGIVDPAVHYVGTTGSWLTYTMTQYESNIIVYPYSFNYSFLNENKTETLKHYSRGAFITYDPSSLDHYAKSNMGIKTNSTVSIQKARALYDTDIAILSIEAEFDNYVQDLFQDAQDWCTFFQGILIKSCLSNYDLFYEQKIKNSSKTYVIRINETSVREGKLISEDGFPRFGILIIPDYKLGTDTVIKSLLGNDGINNLKKYYNAGGNLIVTGKSGTLLEDFNLIAKGLYDRKYLFSSDRVDRKIIIKGCNDSINKTYTKTNITDFKKQILCMVINLWNCPALSSTFRMVKSDVNLIPLLDIEPNFGNLILTNIDDGISENLTNVQKSYIPLILTKVNDQSNGQLLIMNFNPVHGNGDKIITFNTIVLALSKEMYMTTKINNNLNSGNSNLPIPAGEVNVQLGLNILFHNLNDEIINDFQMYLFLPEHFNWLSSPPTGCEKRNDFKSIPSKVLSKKTFTDETNNYLLCKINSIEAYEKRNFNLSIIVSDYQATQNKYSVLILIPVVLYKDSENYQNLITQYVKVNAEEAPVLRVAINPDPSAYYPVYGEGSYIDNVLKIENKGLSKANEVEYIGLIPLISPLTDSGDQSILKWNLKIYTDYYNSKGFEVPFESDNASDYIYTSELVNKGVIIAAEWDSPVLPVKEINAKGEVGKEVNITGINLGMLNVESTSEIIKQVNYRKAERFYKLASQRLIVFVDDTSPKGAKTLYGDNIPTELRDPVWKDRAKKEFLFLRNDVYFYDNENYVNPPGINEKIIFSLDNFIAYEKNKNGCVKSKSEAQSKKVYEGYFSNKDDDKKTKILDPSTYTNELFEICDLTIVDPLSEESIKKVFGNINNFRPTHYTIPNVESTIVQPTQIYGFVQDDDIYHGHLEKYPSVKFIYLHSLNYIIDTKTCFYGGLIEINLGDKDILNSDDITVSPDQIAVYKTEYENHIIKIYFKRGLMSNEQSGKDMKIIINIENIKSTITLKLNVKLYEIKYDISFPPTYEHYIEIRNENLDFNYVSVFSYPALELKTKLNRTLNGLETMEPFSRYGVYIQELIAHRYIFGIEETHHQNHPGLTGNSLGFSSISNLGISSIPFLEYVSAGSGQVIPAGTSTARASWKDIWGRNWCQPLRTVFPDIPPLPPVLKNFMMTTTFALLRNGKIVTEWNSDEDIKILLHVKLLNNYPKYFEITRCKENQILYVPKNEIEEHDREYGQTCDDNLDSSEWNGNKMFLKQGGFASYGICYATDGAYVQSKEVTNEFKEEILKAKLCADYTDEELIKQCEEELKNITTLKKSSTDWDQTKKWNYSPLVENFYPKGYINNEMWQLIRLGDEDNSMDKAYKLHVDNIIPNLDNKILKPQNTIAIPLYKGLGYDITYDKNNEIDYHGEKKKGWWSDNLQNKDHTLLAGQELSNEISVDKKNLINSWVDALSLVGSKRSKSDEQVKKIINNRLKNIYVCLFNRNRPEYNPNCGKNYFASNVNQNNIIPIVIDLEKDDKKLSQFQCNGTTQYTPENLKDYEGNYLQTSTNKDYLYFGANLRTNAKESFNIALNLKKIKEIKYEGIVKVNEGGRLIYFNPPNGPNSFLIVDNPVSVINGKRNDIDIKTELFPLTTTTFNAVVYHLYTIYDENKINKEWPFNDYYFNNYGFGDVAVSVYVGGIKKSKAVIEPGQTTYIKITFMNNCGFDWNMKAGAIDFENKGSQHDSADLMKKFTHTVQEPKKYNFLNITIDDLYSKYITIEPSDHNIDVPPEFFDFQNINVVSIIDSFKGEYYLKVKLSSDFPEKLRGKPIEIKFAINTEYFDHFPGTDTDLTKKNYHTYNVTVPSAYIAVPFKSGKFAGKVLYTSAQASDITVQFNTGFDWSIDDIKYVDEDTIYEMRKVITGEETLINSGLKKIWESLNSTSINYTSKFNTQSKTIYVNGLNEKYPLFPKINIGAPDTANISFLIKSSVAQLASGYTSPIYSIATIYKDWMLKRKSSSGINPSINAKGAWLVLSYSRTLVEDVGNGKYAIKVNQELSQTDEGIMKVQFKLENRGSGNSYNTKYEIIIQPNLTFIGHNSGTNKITQKKNELSQTILTFDYGTPINAGELKGGIIYLKFTKCIESFDLLTQEQIKNLPTELKVAQESSVTMDLTEVNGENQVTQHLRNSLTFAYTEINKAEIFVKLVVSGRRNNPNVEISAIVKHAINETDNDVVVSISKLDLTNYEEKEVRKLAALDDDNYQYIYLKKNKPISVVAEDKPVKDENKKNHIVSYNVLLYNKKNKRYSSNQILFNQEDIGISTSELILILLSILLYACTALLIWFGIKNLKLNKQGNLFEKEIRNTQLDKLVD